MQSVFRRGYFMNARVHLLNVSVDNIAVRVNRCVIG